MDDIAYHNSVTLLGPTAEPIIRQTAILHRLLPYLYTHVGDRPLHWYGGVDPRKVLTLPWSERRLAATRELRHTGQRPPLAQLTRVRVSDDTWYMVNDGQHRVWAAREVGARRIGAYVDWEIVACPSWFYLQFTHEEWIVWQHILPATNTAWT